MILFTKRKSLNKNEIAIDARDCIIENFSIDLSDYDVVIGYRKDDIFVLDILREEMKNDDSRIQRILSKPSCPHTWHHHKTWQNFLIMQLTLVSLKRIYFQNYLFAQDMQINLNVVILLLSQGYPV